MVIAFSTCETVVRLRPPDNRLLRRYRIFSSRSEVTDDVLGSTVLFARSARKVRSRIPPSAIQRRRRVPTVAQGPTYSDAAVRGLSPSDSSSCRVLVSVRPLELSHAPTRRGHRIDWSSVGIEKALREADLVLR